jgi:hypothetical protein
VHLESIWMWLEGIRIVLRSGLRHPRAIAGIMSVV